MKICKHKGRFYLRAGMGRYTRVLDEVTAVTPDEVIELSLHDKYDDFMLNLIDILNSKSRKYDVSKVANILSDGIFTLNLKGEMKLVSWFKNDVNRGMRMLTNLSTASELGVEVQLKNSMLSKQKDEWLWLE